MARFVTLRGRQCRRELWGKLMSQCSAPNPAGALLVLAFLPSTAALGGGSSPNIILIMTDDQGWNGTSVAMDPNVPGSSSDYYQTPTLESMAAAGVAI